MYLRQLPLERHILKQRNEDHTPQSNRIMMNVVGLEEQWMSIRKQHVECRSSSKSPARNNLENQLKKQCILKKVVPLSTINLTHVQEYKNLKVFALSQYSNIHRKQSHERARTNSYEKQISVRKKAPQYKNDISLTKINSKRKL
ncbi:hypothetical protein pb186bvf_001374 [Paramecium bursaria]